MFIVESNDWGVNFDPKRPNLFGIQLRQLHIIHHPLFTETGRWRQLNLLGIPGDVGQLITNPQAFQLIADIISSAFFRQVPHLNTISIINAVTQIPF